MRYPVIGTDLPWKNPREVGYTININGTDIIAVPSQDAVVGDILMGDTGFEAEAPYVLVDTADVSAMGDLHGATVTIETNVYVVRNIREKPNQGYMRLILDKRS